jgi:NtrC-family two-component system response regulator AlgB
MTGAPGDNLATILLLGDDWNTRHAMADSLTRAGYRVVEYDSANSAAGYLSTTEVDLIVSELRPSALHDDGLLELIRRRNPTIPAIFVTAGESAIDAAPATLGDGSVIHPVANRQLPEAVARILGQGQPSQDHPLQDQRLPDQSPIDNRKESAPASDFFVAGETSRRIEDFARQAAASDAVVLLTGETGTGKGVIARYIHANGRRRGRPFLELPCITLGDHLLGDHALTDQLSGDQSDGDQVRAEVARNGSTRPFGIEAVSGGTIFFDEVGELSPSLQGKLLCVLTERAAGSAEGAKLLYDVRVIAATNRNLDELVAANRFRADLFFRLNVVELTIPPLRARFGEIVPFAEHFVRQIAERHRQPAPTFGAGVEAALMAHNWPGNLRELRNVIERAMVLRRGDQIELADLPDRIASHNQSSAPAMSLDELEKLHIETIVRRARTFEEAAETLGINVATLWRKRRRYGLG